MPALHLDGVSFRYSSAADVITEASFDLGPGWTGVVGGNGMGKSTLLRLIAGELAPDTGSIHVEPAGRLPTLCHQEVGDLVPAVPGFARATDGASRRLIGTLRLRPDDLERWETLSPGERKRWQIGAALAADPDVLLLDEPTNHIDTQARAVLIEALDRFDGVGLVVSHDRTLLNRLTTHTLLIDQGSVQLWNGNYDTARRGWEAAAAERHATYATTRAEQRKLQRRISDQRRAAEAKRATHRRTVRRAGVKDHDARSVEAKGRHEAGDAAAARRLQAARAESERLADRLATFEMRRDAGSSFFFDYDPPRRRRLLSYRGPLRAGDRLLAADVAVDLEREDRVWLRGPNGAGKTTLLATLAEQHRLPPHRLLYLPQELPPDAGVHLLEELRNLPSGAVRGRVLSLVAVLGVEPDRLLATDRPSPGEARKLAMALGMGRSAWCLLLDEPTNHLDLPTVERLEEAIAGYPGAVLLVTHDRDFAEATTTATWHLEAGELVRPYI